MLDGEDSFILAGCWPALSPSIQIPDEFNTQTPSRNSNKSCVNPFYF